MPKSRKWTFRVVSILLGLSVFILFEGVCRITGWGAEPPSTSAFAEFATIRPLFELTADGQNYQVAENRRLFFAEESFAAEKQPQEFRIFVFGGSTVQGRPFSIPTAFTTFLEIGLRLADPSVRWEVVNCGGISYASYRLLPILKECQQYQPDLYIVCTGHNEFLECVTYASVKTSSVALTRSYSWLNQFHSFHLAEQTLGISQHTESGPANTLPAEVDTILDHEGGLDLYGRSTLHSAEIVAGFRDNLQQMVSTTQSAGVPLVFLLPPSNIRDCPPFKSEFHQNLNTDAQQAIAQKLKSAAEWFATDTSKSIQILKSATDDDSGHAITWYQLGQALLHANRIEEAYAALVRARDEDVCPLRMTSALENTLRTVAEQYRVPLLDINQQLQSKSRNSIVGDAVLVDHVHPSFRSHQDIAIALIDLMQRHKWLSVHDAKWQQSALSEFDQHLQSLEDMYFLRGRRTLEALQEWTQGRADRPPLVPAAAQP